MSEKQIKTESTLDINLSINEWAKEVIIKDLATRDQTSLETATPSLGSVFFFEPVNEGTCCRTFIGSTRDNKLAFEEGKEEIVPTALTKSFNQIMELQQYWCSLHRMEDLDNTYKDGIYIQSYIQEEKIGMDLRICLSETRKEKKVALWLDKNDKDIYLNTGRGKFHLAQVDEDGTIDTSRMLKTDNKHKLLALKAMEHLVEIRKILKKPDQRPALLKRAPEPKAVNEDAALTS